MRSRIAWHYTKVKGHPELEIPKYDAISTIFVGITVQKCRAPFLWLAAILKVSVKLNWFLNLT